MNSCRHLDPVVKLAEAEGNFVLSTSQSELMQNVKWMNNQLSDNLRERLFLNSKLTYKKTMDAPHDPATEYFICEECKCVVIFPKRTAK